MPKFIDLTGKTFGKLTVIKKMDDKVGNHIMWLCKCDCGNVKTIRGSSLTSGESKSCGCVHRGGNSRKCNNREQPTVNTYNLSGEYGIGYTSKGKEFYFDLEDYDKVKKYCWFEAVTPQGYHMLQTNTQATHKIITMSQLLVGVWYDHINRNPFDNRKTNLRPCSQSENARNKSIPSHNSSNVIGVSWRKDRQKWRAFIQINNTYRHLGYFISKNDAIKTRLLAEKEYFGEFAPQQHLFKEYNIT